MNGSGGAGITSLASDSFGDAGRALTADRHQSLHRTSRAIEGHCVASLDQTRPSAAHDAEANEGNGAHSGVTFCWRSQRRLSIVVVVGMYSSPT